METLKKQTDYYLNFKYNNYQELQHGIRAAIENTTNCYNQTILIEEILDRFKDRVIQLSEQKRVGI